MAAARKKAEQGQEAKVARTDIPEQRSPLHHRDILNTRNAHRDGNGVVAIALQVPASSGQVQLGSRSAAPWATGALRRA